MIRRINMFGGPCSGKSGWAEILSGMLKRAGLSIELSGEYVKGWSYQNRTIHPYDQLYIFAKQHQYEYRYLTNKVQYTITDSPTFLAAVYSQQSNPLLEPHIREINSLYEEEFPSLAIFINHKYDKETYKESGRYQTMKQAEEVHNTIKSWLDFYKPYHKYIEIDKNEEPSNVVYEILEVLAAQ